VHEQHQERYFQPQSTPAWKKERARKEKKTCNCHVKAKCPFDSKYLSTSIVYKAEISTSDGEETKEYIGMTTGTFKKRYANHKSKVSIRRLTDHIV
jgi:hypothetical protein